MNWTAYIISSVLILVLAFCALNLFGPEETHFHRSRGVAVCGSGGVVVGYDAQDDQYTWSSGAAHGDLAKGQTPMQFCAGR